MLWSLIQSFIRHSLTSAGAILITHGLASQADTNTAVGALMVLIGFGYSVVQKWNATPPPTSQGGKPGGSVPLLLLFVSGTLFFSAGRSQAQSTNSPAQGIGTTIENITLTLWSYGTEINTNLFWQPVQVWTCPVWNASGATIADETGASADLIRPASQTGFFVDPEIRLRNSSTPGTVVSTGAGGQVGYQYYDIRAGAYLDGGYNSLLNKAYIEPGAFFDKMLTPNTAAGFFSGWNSSNHAWLLGVNVQVTFGSGNGFLGIF